MNHLEEIRAKLSIEEIVGGYIQLKKAGRNLKGLCPFHSDSNPSFTVSPDKGIAYCFACSTGGDIFKFIQLIEKVEFPEAVRILAERAGVKLPEYKPQQHDERVRLLEVNRKTESFFEQQLKKHPRQVEYLHDRGLTDETIEAFGLGFAPDSYHSLKDHLNNEGVSEKDMLAAGVVSQRDMADKTTYDRFRNRVMFPIHDHQGNAVGFGGRIVGDGEPKYLNSPETPLYNKSLVLYGLERAKESIKSEDMAIFVEGYMDVIAAHQVGTKNVVATSGTALTPQQIRLVKRYSRRIAFAFDQDTAGLEATRRAIEIAQEQEMDIRIVKVPEGKDPDECIKNFPEKWLEASKNPVPIMDFYFDHALSKYDAGNLEGRKAILAELLPIIKQFPTQMEQGEHLTRLSTLLRTDVKYLWNDLKNLRVSSYQNAPQQNAETPAPRRNFSREEFLLGFILNYPELYPAVHENMIDHLPIDSVTEKFYKACKNLYNRGSAVNVSALKEDLTAEESEKIDVYALLVEEHYPDFSDDAARMEINSLVREINRSNLHRVQKDFEFRIRSAEAGDKTLLLNQYNQILKLKSKI